MITYFVWKSFIEELTIYTLTSEKMAIYAFCSFSSIITIILDIATIPFQLIGILIYIITNRKK